MLHKVVFDEPNSLFRVSLEAEHEAIMKFEVHDDVYVITSTKVPEALQGKGYGKVMMETILPELERLGVTIKPVGSYFVHYLSRHPVWSLLVTELP
jgi:predicted GNAT family acetyltransferase